ncbi:paraquat-inducible protein A [Aeromonas hydrophila]|uniref:paraquat-inducible protein A n=1 Tax=Aeromonas hydrophila TaxID=644 RepID=UPI000444BCEA|nr:paraquat-inducible protein A [Aeromonas hydrophila]AHX34409.1 paraquat-inducible protein A [Aeromonas hydrophila subsp. hydrophila AL09-71]AHX71209.1 paraquat-inducible protein A [Aeromonas hydrophila pc104A]AJE34850.1 paraquat-inducible protein A [Aeromonas hydrophila J-1]AKJ33046.1 paraquat-inducible protein A [Aeromonas hydrophila NJ-35]ALQ61873.1 paraquat-inducible protein A [Aeromonas hydrophila]
MHPVSHQHQPTYTHDATACEECDLLVPATTLAVGEASSCPRCGHTLSRHLPEQERRPIAYGFAAIIMFVLSNSFTFMSFSAKGVGQEMTFLQCITTLVDQGYLFLGAVLSLTLIGLPLVYIGSIMLVLWRVDKDLHSNALRSLGRLLCRIKPWLMVDVFLIGVLISLVKLMGMADIKMGLSFWAFVGYTVLLIKMISSLDRMWLWQRLFGPSELHGLTVEDDEASAMTSGLVGCHICGALSEAGEHSCPRCGGKLHSRKPGGLNRTWALLFTSVILYVPANLYPIMDTVFLGDDSPSTILGGVVLLWAMGSYPIAAVIFIASVVVPLVKILALLWLCYMVQRGHGASPLGKLKLYRMTEFVGRWSMIDVFVVAILAGLIRLDNLMTIYPGPAAVAFAGVVLITMVAAMSFDSRLIWDLQQGERERE